MFKVLIYDCVCDAKDESADAEGSATLQLTTNPHTHPSVGQSIALPHDNRLPFVTAG